jgi:ADP-ribose pyrophosphatase YjhB (NUDIX family)
VKTVADDQMITSTRAVIFSGSGEDLRILLVRRKFPPYDGSLTLPGGFMKGGDSSLSTIKRKVIRETSLDLSENFTHYKLSSRSHNLDPRSFQITDNYLFLANGEKNYDEVELTGEERPEWYYLDEVERLGFNHGAILCEALGLLWNKLPVGYKNKIYQCAPDAYSSKNIKWSEPVAFFSGTFNPWHDGHQACLDQCPNKNIIIVPDSNPWKVKGDRGGKRCHWQDYRELAHRFEKSEFAVFPGYFGIEEGNPTVSWYPYVDCEKKEFLMGLDSFFSFPRWKNVSTLLNSIEKLYVVPRFTQERSDGKEVVEQIKKLKSDIDIVFLNEHSFMNVSSTELRKR